MEYETCCYTLELEQPFEPVDRLLKIRADAAILYI
jgi:hypothetical protein